MREVTWFTPKLDKRLDLKLEISEDEPIPYENLKRARDTLGVTILDHADNTVRFETLLEVDWTKREARYWNAGRVTEQT